MEVGERQRHVLGVGAVASDDAEYRPRLAVGRPRVAARLADAAHGVDLAHHAAPDPCRVRRLDDLADELVADDARERVVAAGELDVGAADARERDADERLAICLRPVDIAHRQLTIFEPQRLHGAPFRSVLPVVPTRKAGRARPPRRAPRRTGCCTGRSRSPSAASSSSCVPCSMMRPWSMTRIVSASRIVESRCAITKLVRFFMSSAIAFWISTSVRVSTELVASSRIRICGSARNARAIVSSCFSPCETFEASSSSTVS